MRWVPAPIEIIGYLALALIGLYVLYMGTADHVTAFLLCGAVGFTVGTGTFIVAIKNALWHRQMMRRTLNQKLDI